MTGIELVNTLQQQGFILTPLPGNKLAVKPADRITDELRERIRQKKSEVIELLMSRRPASEQNPTLGTTIEPVTFWTDSRDIDPANPPAPYLNERGELIVPFESHPRFHWWGGGQSIHTTLIELNAAPDVIARYVEADTMRVKQ